MGAIFRKGTNSFSISVKRIILFSTFILSSLTFFASHIVGGEMIYQCLGGYNYQVTLKLYRDCSSPFNAAFDNPAYIGLYDGYGNPVNNFLDIYGNPTNYTSVALPPTTIISPPPTSCYTFPANVCVEEADYTTTLYLPPLSGGYTVVYQRCCRNATIQNIINPSSTGSTYYATIPDPGSMCNNSPYFKNLPPIFLCMGSQLAVDNSAVDADGDSLYYYFCDPLNGADPINSQPAPPAAPPYTAVSWASPYTATNPLSASPGLTIDPKTGIISGTPNLLGQWVVGVCVNEYRSGQLIGIHHRDFQFNVTNCPGLLIATVNSSQDASCNSTSSGNASIATSGGTAPLSYNWSPTGGSGVTAFNLYAGTYTITVTDAYACTSTTQVTINQPTVLNANASASNATCGNSNGSVSVTASGGTAPYYYFWNTTATGQTISGLAAGNYKVTVTDSKGCTQTALKTISNTGGASLAVVSVTDANCNGQTSGGAVVSASGGTPGYVYTWSLGAGGATISGVAANTYTVTVTDGGGCVASAIVTINQPAALTLSTSSANAACGNSNGQATAFPGGGTPGYNYLWNTSATGQTVSGLSANTYTVTVTDLKGCTKSTTTIVSSTSGVIAGIASSSSVSCNSGNNGTASVSITGGTPGYNFAWSPGGATSQTVSGLSANTYTVTITDGNSCTSTASVIITQPTALSVSTIPVNSTCGNSNGQATATAGGGNGSYSFIWSNTINTNSISSVAAGIYTVTITDSKGCTSSSTANIGNTGGPTLSVLSSTDVTCSGNANGTATAGVSGGTSGFNYVWFPGGTTGSAISGLSAGNYTVSVTDANGCTSTSTVNITEPSALTPSTSSVSASCGASNGSVSISATGGTPFYTYLWNTTATSQTVNGLPSGSYTATVTDSKGCTQVAIQTINNSGAATVNIASSTDIQCYGGANGTVSVTITGGVAPLTYNWSNSVTGVTSISGLTAGSYTISVTDANGCLASSNVTLTQPALISPAASSQNNATCGKSNGQAIISTSGGTGSYTYLWSDGSTNSTLSAVASNTYTLTVTDAQGCTVSTTVNIGNSGGPSARILSSANTSCFGNASGTATADGSGGTPNYTYVWSSGDIGAVANGLSANTYTVSVSDANGCVATSTVIIGQPALISLTTSSTPAACGSANGSASVIANGGTPGYSYLWYNSSTLSTLNAQLSGSYTVTVTDANGCSQTTTAAIGSSGGATIASQSVSNVKCKGGNTGSATITTNGGTAPVTASWSNSATGNSDLNLSAGTYFVTISDANGCTATTSVVITEPSALTASTSATAAGCGVNNGTASANASGGFGIYTYLWSNTSTNQNINNLAGGTYIVTITDANNCTNTSSVVVANTGAAILTVSGGTSMCYGQSATINAVPSGGSGPYTYSWSNGLSGAGPHIVSPTGNTTYTIAVTDANGCTSTVASITVNVSPALSLTASATAPAICNGSTATLIANASGGNGSTYTYTWLPSGTTTTTATFPVTPVSTTTYTIELNDNCSTPASTTIKVTVNQPPVVSVAADVTSGCTAPLCVNFIGTSTGACSSSAWTFGDGGTSVSSNPNYCYNNTGSYTVTFTCTDINGCSATSTNTSMITLYGKPSADFSASSIDVVQNESIDFTDLSSGIGSVIWNFADPGSGSGNTSTLSKPSHSFQDTGTYCVTLTALSTAGCSDTKIKCVHVKESCILPDSIPNVFTPNNDGKNDLFIMKSQGLADLHCSIYNRWGSLIFEYNAVNIGWDGRTFTDLLAPDGTYYYILDATCQDGRKKAGNGFVQLIK